MSYRYILTSLGFTAISERQPPEAVISLLRDFHAHMERVIFDHGGTLDKYIGDGVMVTFGTPRPAADDATRAVRCAQELLRSVAAWNDVRIAQGEEAVRIAVGVHYGPVIAGDVGGGQRLEYTVVGDTVNVASRLEQLTRKLNVSLLASEELLEAAKAESGLEESDLGRFEEVAPQEVRGRHGILRLWALAGENSTPGGA